MHSSIISWLERRIFFVDRADEVKLPSLRPAAFTKETPADLGEGCCNFRGDSFQDLGRDLVIPSGSRLVQLPKQL